MPETCLLPRYPEQVQECANRMDHSPSSSTVPVSAPWRSSCNSGSARPSRRGSSKSGRGCLRGETWPRNSVSPVARMREAYERLVDERLIVASGAAGTYVAGAPAPKLRVRPAHVTTPSDLPLEYSTAPLPFQMGVPAQDAFPAKLWARLFTTSARAEAFCAATYADPCGEPALREQIAAYLAIARGLRCAPEASLRDERIPRRAAARAGTVLRVAGRASAARKSMLSTDLRGRRGSRLAPTVADVDEEGLNVEAGIADAPDAAVVVVTSGAAGTARRDTFGSPTANCCSTGRSALALGCSRTTTSVSCSSTDGPCPRWRRRIQPVESFTWVRSARR